VIGSVVCIVPTTTTNHSCFLLFFFFFLTRQKQSGSVRIAELTMSCKKLDFVSLSLSQHQNASEWAIRRLILPGKHSVGESSRVPTHLAEKSAGVWCHLAESSRCTVPTWQNQPSTAFSPSKR